MVNNFYWFICTETEYISMGCLRAHLITESDYGRKNPPLRVWSPRGGGEGLAERFSRVSQGELNPWTGRGARWCSSISRGSGARCCSRLVSYSVCSPPFSILSLNTPWFSTGIRKPKFALMEILFFHFYIELNLGFCPFLVLFLWNRAGQILSRLL